MMDKYSQIAVKRSAVLEIQTEFAMNKNKSFSLDALEVWPANWR
jgi:hypothetical protein